MIDRQKAYENYKNEVNASWEKYRQIENGTYIEEERPVMMMSDISSTLGMVESIAESNPLIYILTRLLK